MDTDPLSVTDNKLHQGYQFAVRQVVEEKDSIAFLSLKPEKKRLRSLANDDNDSMSDSQVTKKRSNTSSRELSIKFPMIDEGMYVQPMSQNLLLLQQQQQHPLSLTLSQQQQQQLHQQQQDKHQQFQHLMQMQLRMQLQQQQASNPGYMQQLNFLHQQNPQIPFSQQFNQQVSQLFHQSNMDTQHQQHHQGASSCSRGQREGSTGKEQSPEGGVKEAEGGDWAEEKAIQ